MWDGIVTRIQSDDESNQVRFPLRRQRPQEFNTTDAAGDSVAQGAVVATEDKAAEFEPPLGAGTPEGTRPETPALAAVRDPLPFPRPPAPPSAPPPRLRAEAGPPAHEAPPSLPVAPLASSLFTVPLRGQASASDARADRLVRQVRGEIEQLRQSFQALSTEHGEMLHVDPADIAANPEAALGLPPAVLVRTILAVHACNAESEMRRKRQAKRLAKLQARLRKFAIEDAETRGRLGTLEEVISALHANLEDLRLERGSAPRVLTTPGLPSLPQPLLARQHESSAPELGRQNSELRTQNSEPSPGNGQDA